MHGSLSTKLRILRVERGLTLRDAEQLTGVDKDTLSKIERGRRYPHDITLSKIAKGYGVPVEELLEEPPPKAPSRSSHEAEGSEEEERRALADVRPWFYAMDGLSEHLEALADPNEFDAVEFRERDSHVADIMAGLNKQLSELRSRGV